MTNRLKSLEIQGYKTFASRYTFEFAGTITAIVGPNGSGKSNIVDGIRWVLGEQSFSLLRGKRTEDMIFSGSEQRSRAGMAAVSVTFDNSDNWLPIDYSEVAITRRAYRDGQNEYLINGQKVRLKDVGELLAQSGLAERTYTIIGQGLVDAALSLRAEERRRLFEEAAGIGLHRYRREEALKRLENTRRNLDRVQDILAELQPRLRSLERQARRAQEYAQIQADLKVILLEWYGFHWHQAQKDLIRAREAAELQETNLSQVRERQEKLAAEINEQREKIHAQRGRLNSWHRELANLHNQREQIGRELAVADERGRSYLVQHQTSQDEMLRQNEERELLQGRLENIQNEILSSQQELVAVQQSLTLSQDALQERQAERKLLEENLDKLLAQYSDDRTRLNQLQARLGERISEVDRLKKEQVDLQATIQSGNEQITSQAERNAAAQRKLSEEQAARKVAEDTYSQHLNFLQEAETARQKLLEQNAAEIAGIARYKTQIEVLDQAEQSLAGYGEGTKVLLEAGRQGRIKSIRNALGSRLDVPAELETAIEAALGDFVDSVLLENEADIDLALELAKEKNVRGSLLPYNHIQTETVLEIQEAEGILGTAAMLIKAPAELRPAVDLLLGHVIVVNDRAAARKALKGRSSPVRAVTLQGEVFYASGLVSASRSSAETEAHSSLGRTRQQKILRQNLATLEAKAAQTQQEIDAKNNELQAHRNRENELSLSREHALQVEREIHLEFERTRLSLENFTATNQFHEKRNQNLVEQIKAGEIAVQDMRDQINNLKTEVEKSQESVRNAQRTLAEFPEDDYLDQVNHWRTSLAVTEESTTSLNRRKQDLQQQLQRVNQYYEQLEEKQRKLQDAINTLGVEQNNFRQKDALLSQEVDELVQMVQPNEVELEMLENQLIGLTKEDETIRSALSSAEHRNAQARIILNKQIDTLESLRRRIEDDFGLVEFAYENEVSGPTPLPFDGMVEKLPVVKEISGDLEDALLRKRAQLRRMGAVNPEAQREYEEVRDRFQFMTTQVEDLNKAEQDLREVIDELDLLMRQEFQKTFDAVANEFRGIFARLFGGGSARLILTDPDDITNTGIDIEARLPGRRSQGLSLLSGGERSLTAAALVFALLKTSPTPFCVLDEVDAMLDEANVGRFRDLLKELSENTQFIIITHNRNTVQAADVIYGVTMGKDSTSQVLSLRLDEVSEIAQV
jgi:chromosome segregation protein